MGQKFDPVVKGLLGKFITYVRMPAIKMQICF